TPSNTNDPNQIDIVWTKFMFEPSPDYITPFSWHLTTSQKAEIHEAWRYIKAWGKVDEAANRPKRPRKSKTAPIRNNRQESPLATLDQFFPRVDRRTAQPAGAESAKSGATAGLSSSEAPRGGVAP